MNCSCNNFIERTDIVKHFNSSSCADNIGPENKNFIKQIRIKKCLCNEWFHHSTYHRHIEGCKSIIEKSINERNLTELLDENNKLKQELQELRLKYDAMFLNYSKQITALNKLHNDVWGKDCVETLKMSFEDYIEDFSEQKKLLYKKEWENFMKKKNGFSKASVKEYIGFLLNKKKLMVSTVSKKYGILKNIFQNCYGVSLPEISQLKLIDYVKEKYHLSEKEIYEFLEFLRNKCELGLLNKGYLLFCSILFCYGMRPAELFRVNTQSFSSYGISVKLLDYKASRFKDIKLFDFHHKYLKELCKDLDKDEPIFGYLGNWSTVKTRIRRLMIEYFGPTKVDEIQRSNKAIGVYCCRKTCLNESFIKAYSKAKTTVRSLSKHRSIKSLNHYIKISYRKPIALESLSNYNMLGRKRNRIFLDSAETNFKLSQKYLQNVKEEKKMCSFCKLIIFDNFIKCETCNDYLHTACNLIGKSNKCIRCYFLYVDYKVYLSINKSQCLHCKINIGKNPKNIICCDCLNKISIFKPGNRIKVEETKISGYAKAINSQTAWFKSTLTTALEKQNLKLTTENVCCKNKCTCLTINNALYFSKMKESTKSYYLSMKKNVPPLAVAFSEKLGGYFVFATAKIEKNTMITEYLGDVFDVTETIFDQNDSHMYIINGGCSDNSKVIIPKNFANIAKFISGAKEEKHANIKSQSMYTNDDKINHIILYSIENIEPGDILYYLYHGTYPTRNFNHIKNIGHVIDENLIASINNSNFKIN